MSTCNFILIIGWFFLTHLLQENVLKNNPKRQINDKCNDTVVIKECTGKEYDVQLNLSRIKTNQFVANYHSNCKFADVKYTWKIYDDIQDEPIVDYVTNNVFVLHPFALKTGSYGVTVEVTFVRNGNRIPLIATCTIEMERLDPVAVIHGGSERTLEAGHSFVVDGSKSIDRDKAPNEPSKLTYSWTCQVIQGTINDLCAKTYKEKTLKVASRYAVTNHKYVFVLSVRNTYLNKWITSNQTITILRESTELEIICEKNCPPAAPKTDSKRLTFLRVKCLRHCDGVEASRYEWSVEGQFDYAKSTQLGRNTDKFIIKEGVLQAGQDHKVQVKLTDRQGAASRILEAQTFVKIESCEVKPSVGTSIETKFRVGCKYTGLGYSFEIFTSKNNNSVGLTKSYNIDSLEFALPSDSDVFIKISDVNGVHDVHKLSVSVNAGVDKGISNFTDSMKTLIANGDMDAAIQITNGFIATLDKSPEAPQAKKEILESLDGVIMKSQDDARQVSSLVTMFVNNPKAESDPYQAETATKICKEAAKVDLEYSKKENYPQSLGEETKETVKTLMKCGETDTKENFDVLKPVPLDFEVTTPFPVLPVPVIEEQYPDYVLDDTVDDKKKKYEVASRNFVAICEKNLEMISLTVVEGENTVVAGGTNSSAQVTKLVGTELVETDIEIQGASFRISRDLEKVPDPIEVMVCSWVRDPFWWNPAGTTVSTNVVLVKVLSDNQELTQFQKPNRIILELEDQKIKIHEIQIANKSLVRVDVKKNESFFVEFHNLSQTDSLRVLITNFDKPELSEVREHGKAVTKADNVLFQEEMNGFDSWYYVSVLPDPEVDEFKYWISVYTKSCYSWSSTGNKWEFACKSGYNSNKNQIVCFCNHLSILAGIVYNNRIKIDEVTTDTEFEMVLLRCFYVFIRDCTTFALYLFILTVMVAKKSVKRKNIFLPGDISTSARYVYLVGIETGSRLSSGTSSNICIKVFGDHNKSRSHVLNFPDPQKRIFQRNNLDWFILPTVHRLGNLTEIHLWSDHSGRHPRWFCHGVTIYDLQLEKKWYFRVKKWFDLPPNGQIFLKVAASEEKKKSRFGLLFFRILPKCTHQEGFSDTKKLTLLLSSLLTIYATCLFMDIRPEWQLRDGFEIDDPHEFYPTIIWYALGSAVISFVFHTFLIWLFRKADKKEKFATLAWILLITAIIVIMTVLVIDGFWVPNSTSWLWLISILIAAVFYYFILENLYDLWVDFYKTDDSLKWVLHVKSLMGSLEVQRTHLFRKFGENLLRPYFARLYRPMDEDDIKERKLHEESKKKFFALLEDTIMFICYVTLLYLAIFANKNPMTVRNHDQMVELLSGYHTRTMSYTTDCIDEIYTYVNQTLIPTLHAQQWYSKYVVKDPGTMADFTHKVLGVARLRQKRVSQTPCEVPEFSKNGTCRLEFWYAEQDFTNFGPENKTLSRLLQIWNYTKASEAGFSVYVGKFGIYHGGGFIAPLGRTWFNSYANLLYLANHTWLDSQSVAVIIEFLSYNVNTNLFNSVKVVFEKSATGYLRSLVDLKTAQFLFIKEEAQYVEIAIFVSFALILCVFSLKFLVRIWKGKFLVLKDLWIFVDLLIVGLSYSCFALFVHRTQLVKQFLDKIEIAKKNEFINYFSLFHEDITFTLVAAFLVFVATIRLWKVCRFGTVFQIMEKTIILSAFPILVVLLFHMLVITAYTLSGNVIFGTISHNFKDIPDTLITLMLLTVGFQEHFDLETLHDTNPHLAKGYYSSFMLVNLLFLTIYIAVIMIYYYEARVVASGINELSHVRHFLSKEFLFYKTLLKMSLARLRGGTIRKQFVSAKPDELRFANCMTLPLSTLELMCCCSIYDLKKYSMSHEEKVRLMHRVVRSQNSDSIEIFFSEKTETRIRIIHDNKMRRIGVAAQLILSYDEKKRKREELKYKRIVDQQINKLNFISQVLSAVLRVVSNIKIE